MTADDFIVEVTRTFEEDGESALAAAVRRCQFVTGPYR